MIQLTVTGAEQFGALSRSLAEIGRRDLKNELAKAVREAAAPGVAAAKAEVLGVQVTPGAAKGSSGDGGMRSAIAAAIVASTRTGARSASVSIKVSPSRLPSRYRNLPSALNSANGWRHPVFGNTKVWVRQEGRTWFESSIMRTAPLIRLRILAAMESVARKVTT